MKSTLNIRRYPLILSLVFLSQASCSNPSDECSSATASVAITDSLAVDGQSYYLVHRITGWHDKTESFELYDTEPTFDTCLESTFKPLFGEPIYAKDSDNNDQYVAHIYLQPPNRLAFDYVPGAKPRIDHYENLTLKLQNAQ